MLWWISWAVNHNIILAKIQQLSWWTRSHKALAYQDNCCESHQFNPGIYKVVQTEKLFWNARRSCCMAKKQERRSFCAGLLVECLACNEGAEDLCAQD